jgi:DNA-binding GntR family transcriptional regulator
MIMKTNGFDSRRNANGTPVGKTVFAHLRQEILNGNLNHGERLIETEIARGLNISRTPVREALRKLENEGLVVYRTGRGVVVTKVSHDDMNEIYSIRGVLEGLCARLAAERITKKELKTLRELIGQMRRRYSQKDFRGTVQVHTRFNDLIARAAHSPRVQALANRFREYTERSQLRSFGVPERFKAIEEEHEAIMRALESGASQIAEEAVRYHVEQARTAYAKSWELWGV